MTLIFVEDFGIESYSLDLLKEVIWYSRDQTMVIISNRLLKSPTNVLLKFYMLKFLNVIYINIQEFQKSITFQYFPYFKVITMYKFKKETIKNVKNYRLNILCNYMFPLSKCIMKSKKLFGEGVLFRLVENFPKFINGTANFLIEKHSELSDYDILDTFDLRTRIIQSTLRDVQMLYPFHCEIHSKVLQRFSYLVITPKSKYISSFLYITKPFLLSLWIMLAAYLIFGTTILVLSNRIVNRNIEFWKIFDQLFRSLLGQSYVDPIPGFHMNIVYLLIMIFGFIITIFYNSFLGSLLTTYKRNPQISTLHEFKKNNMKIMDEGKFLNTTFGYKYIEDILFPVKRDDVYKILSSEDNSYGYVMNSVLWDTINFSNNYIILKDFHLESNFLRLMFPVFSIFRKPFDRYIDLVHESGLYEIWKQNVNYEIFNILDEYILARLKKSRKINKDDRRILNVSYFIYPLSFLVISWIFGFVSFICERSFSFKKL